MRENKWGGHRPNSGRKKLGNAVLYCRMPQTIVDKIKNAAKSEGLAVGEYLTKMLNV